MKHLLKQILPKSFKKRVYNYFLEYFKERNKSQSSKIPKYQIIHETIKNTKLLLDRQHLLYQMPQFGVVAELGVDKGDFSELILNTCKPDKLYLIDYWGTQRYNEEKKKKVENRFNKEIQDGKVEICLGLSTKVGERFQNEYFDWIYIDTDHSYRTTKHELEIWSQKVKPNGIIAGHDFIVGNWDGIVRYGVIEAVYEFCSNYNWEIIFLTMEIDIHPSFAIRKRY